MLITAVKADRMAYLKKTRLYLSTEDKRQLIKETNTTTAWVYDFYLEHVQIDNFELTDEVVAESYGLSKRVVEKARQDLIKTGWFNRLRFKHDGMQVIIYFLGKSTVASCFGSKSSTEAKEIYLAICEKHGLDSVEAIYSNRDALLELQTALGIAA